MPTNWKKTRKDTWINFKTYETVSLRSKDVFIEKANTGKVIIKSFKTETKARNFTREYLKKNKGW